MRRFVRTFGLITAAVASAGLSIPSASASPGVEVIAFHGTAHINCFGCGSSSGTAALASDAAVAVDLGTVPPGVATPSGTATASYTVQEDPGFSCVVTGSADGTVMGTLINVSFHWTRVGVFAVISVGGSVNGVGVAVFTVDNPAPPSIPCGGPVDASVRGLVVGTF